MKKSHAIAISLAMLALMIGALVLLDNAGRVMYSAPRVEEQEPITLLLIGDIMLDRGVRNAINREGADYPFEAIRELLTSADISVANLEGSLTHEESVAIKNNNILRFTFDPALVGMLKDFGFNGFSLANNHALDFGPQGLKETRENLAAQGLFYFGSPNNNSELSYKALVKGETICYVGYHSLYNAETSSTISELNNLVGQCSYLIVFAHWGEEYQDNENDSQRTIGHAFIDAGADLIIGHHPHVVQPVEIYKGKAIFYSLGNFLFDQDFSLATRQGLAVRLTLSKDSQRFHLIPIEMSRARLYYPEKESYQARMNILISKLPEPYRTMADIDSEFSLDR